MTRVGERKRREAGTSFGPLRTVSLAWVGFAMDVVFLLVILMTIFFLGFASGFGTRAIISQHRRHKALRASEARLGRLASAEGEPRRDSMNSLAVVTALVIVSGVIVLDRFSGPLFPDVFYCLNDGGAQIPRMCTGSHREGIAHAPATDVQRNQRGSAEGSDFGPPQ